MIKWTTPTLTLKVKGEDLSSADVWVTVKQGDYAITAYTSAEYDGADSNISVTFSQEETGNLVRGTADVQVNFKFGDSRGATQVKQIQVYPNLINEVL